LKPGAGARPPIFDCMDAVLHLPRLWVGGVAADLLSVAVDSHFWEWLSTR
jgi:hypothetical protein